MITELYGGVSLCLTDDRLFDNMDLTFLASPKDMPRLAQYLTYDADVLGRRQGLFALLAKEKGLISFFDRLSQNVENMLDCEEAARAIGGTENSETLFYSFRELGFFTEAVEDICKTLSLYEDSPLSSLYNMAKEVKEQTWYENAKYFVETVDDSLRNIKSVTIGINLNSQLMPMEAGIVAVDTEPYVTNSLFDKMFAPQVKDKKMICIAPLGIREAKIDPAGLRALNIHLYRALNDIMKGSLRKIRDILKNQFRQAVAFLPALSEELHFIGVGIRFILDMQAKSLPLCFPKTAEGNERIVGLYDPNLTRSMEAKDIVKNDIVFDEKGRIHLVVGINSGGKSVFLRSVGIAHILFQLGLPIPAREAEMVPFHEIFSCFSHKVADRNGGHLENECRLISTICEKATDKSLILLDELFSGTNSYDASLLAEKVVQWLAAKGSCAVYTTHIYELVTKAEQIGRSVDGKSPVDVWSAELREEKATYKIVKKAFSFESTAMQIFKKYGMDKFL